MKAIETRFISETDHKPARIKAIVGDGTRTRSVIMTVSECENACQLHDIPETLGNIHAMAANAIAGSMFGSSVQLEAYEVPSIKRGFVFILKKAKVKHD